MSESKKSGYAKKSVAEAIEAKAPQDKSGLKAGQGQPTGTNKI